MATVHQSAHPYLFLQIFRRSSRKQLPHLSTQQSQTLLTVQTRSPWAVHFLFDFIACEQMEPSWGNFFLQLDREVYSWTEILPRRTAFFGHILFRVFWEGKLCEGNHCGVSQEELFPGGPACLNSAQRGSVSLSSIADPSPTERRKMKEQRLGVNLSLSFEASDEICLCNSAVPCGTILRVVPTL